MITSEGLNLKDNSAPLLSKWFRLRLLSIKKHLHHCHLCDHKSYTLWVIQHPVTLIHHCTDFICRLWYWLLDKSMFLVLQNWKKVVKDSSASACVCLVLLTLTVETLEVYRLIGNLPAKLILLKSPFALWWCQDLSEDLVTGTHSVMSR